MDYNKQKKLTEKEINYINSKSHIKVVNIPKYPHGYIHVEIAWNLPIKITRNEDVLWFVQDGIYTPTKENHWFVYPIKDKSESTFYTNFLKPKQFINIDEALSYAIKQYSIWLNSRFDYINNLNQI